MTDTNTVNTESISYLGNEERLKIYNIIISGCMHIWSKNALQKDRLETVWDAFASLAEKDPLFLAHLTSYVINKSDSKDLKVLSVLASTLSDADGTVFSPGSSFKKPNWRIIGQAALQDLDPKLVLRVVKLANTKMKFGKKPEATHFSKHLHTAVVKYLRCREAYPQGLKGVRKAGLKNTVQALYRITRTAPSAEAAKILGWKQKPGYPGANVVVDKNIFDFSNMSDLDIAKKIQSEKIPPLAVFGALDKKMSPVIAAAILEQATGDQAVVYTSMFESQGLLKNEEVRKVYAEKVKTAKNALDRVERMNTTLTEETEAMLKQSKADHRKDVVGNIGKVFLHIDVSPSMEAAIEIAKDKASIFAECVKNPETNFFWAAFHDNTVLLPKPQSFVKDAFKAALYGMRCGGNGTNCLAAYELARRNDCDVDVYFTDQQHNMHGYTLAVAIQRSGGKKPNVAVIVNINPKSNWLHDQFTANKIPVTVISPDKLSESALVPQLIRSALLGPVTIIDDIMKAPLLKLPNWWLSVGAAEKVETKPSTRVTPKINRVGIPVEIIPTPVVDNAAAVQ